MRYAIAVFELSPALVRGIAERANKRQHTNYGYHIYSHADGTEVAGARQEVMYLIGAVADEGYDELLSFTPR